MTLVLLQIADIAVPPSGIAGSESQRIPQALTRYWEFQYYGG
jgi:hypothetical protein